MGKSKRHFTEYNPSFRNKVPTTYLPWLIVLSIFIFLAGLAVCILGAVMRVKNDDLDYLLFQFWVGIPMVFVGVCGLLGAIIRWKPLINILAILSLLTMVVCAFGSVTGGLTYWEDRYDLVGKRLDDDKCTVVSSTCFCTDVTVMPMSVDDCDDLELIVRMLISIISLDAFGVVLCFLSFLLTMMINCCGAWTYLPWYDRQIDPDNGVDEEYVEREARMSSKVYNR